MTPAHMTPALNSPAVQQKRYRGNGLVDCAVFPASGCSNVLEFIMRAFTQMCLKFLLHPIYAAVICSDDGDASSSIEVVRP